MAPGGDTEPAPHLLVLLIIEALRKAKGRSGPTTSAIRRTHQVNVKRSAALPKSPPDGALLAPHAEETLLRAGIRIGAHGGRTFIWLTYVRLLKLTMTRSGDRSNSSIVPTRGTRSRPIATLWREAAVLVPQSTVCERGVPSSRTLLRRSSKRLARRNDRARCSCCNAKERMSLRPVSANGSNW